MKQQKLTSGQVSALCRELALMLHAGLGTGESLDLLWEDRDGDPLLERLARQTGEGMPLSEVMEESGAFPAYAWGLVACGERTGRLEEALSALAEHYDSRRRLEERLLNALLHPALLMLLMLAVMVVLLTRVLPVFQEVYASLGGRLTGLAGSLLVFGQVLDRFLPLLASLLALALAFLGAVALSGKLRDWMLSLWSKQGKGLAAETATVRLAQALAMGLASGLALEDSLELAAALQGENRQAAERCRECRRRLEAGDSLAESLRDTGVLPADCCRMLAAGVRAGAADTVMEQVAQRLEERNESHLQAAVARVEPAMVLTCSLMVGAVILSVMLPLMNIMTAMG